MQLPRMLDVATSMFATVSRLGAGVQARRSERRPLERLELYEFEGCPFCRKVRDALTELDLEAMIYPCPHGGTVHRPRAIELGGKGAVPVSRRPATPAPRMYESDDIVDYLYATVRRTRPGSCCCAARSPRRARCSPPRFARPRRHARPPVPPTREAARALELRGEPVLPDRARGALRARAAVRPPQRRQGRRGPAGFHRALRGR